MGPSFELIFTWECLIRIHKTSIMTIILYQEPKSRYLYYSYVKRHYQETNIFFDLAQPKVPFPQFPTTQDMMRSLTGLLFFVFSLQEILAQDFVTVTKCCPVGKIYNSAKKRCVPGAGNLCLELTIFIFVAQISFLALSLQSLSSLSAIS